jgi:hypothetical protein
LAPSRGMSREAVARDDVIDGVLVDGSTAG